MKTKLLTAAIILIFVCSLIPPSQLVSASSYNVNYTLTLEKEDYPDITIQVNGYPDQNAVFVFLGSAANNISSLNAIFQQMEVKDFAGNNLSWQWVDKGISVANGSVKDFIIRYSIDATNFLFPGLSRDPNFSKSVLFRFRLIFFIAGDVFLTPNVEPENIIVDYSLPEGTTLYATLPSENGTFQAIKDLWGNLQADFSMAYFAGGHALFTLNHTTEWGDEYQYIWFDRDPLSEAWVPWYGNTPWEQAELYMESTETCARYYRDTIGTLPNHRVIFTNGTPEYSGFPSAGTNQDFYHYMQIWPRYSEPEICHHVFHQYSFFEKQSKLSFALVGDPIGKMLSEGLPTYYEQVLPSLFFDDQRYTGKLFEFYVLDTRGIPFGIRGNTDYHVNYNLAALKVYLLDQYIRSVTDGKDSLDGFVKAMWEKVKDNPEPQTISQADIRSAFSSVVGSENASYLDQVTNLINFDIQELSDLRSPFSAYSDWMIQEFFWGKPILFYMYLDIAAAKGGEWPHYATYPHNVIRWQSEALPRVWDYLAKNGENPITQKDILNAMKASTGQNHAGFFDFWESLGVTLDPNEIADLTDWDPRSQTLDDALPFTHMSVGTLRSEHLLAGVPQQATIHLDTPAPTNQIFIEYQYIEQGSNSSTSITEKVIQGDNVSVVNSMTFLNGNLNVKSILFKIETDDIAYQDFPITFTYPLGNGVSVFLVSLTIPPSDQLGVLYYLGPIKPISIDLVNYDNEVILPDTILEGETFFTSSEVGTVEYQPGDMIKLTLTSGPVKVNLMDQYGFLRGYSTISPKNLPPTANFDFNINDADSQMTIQFTNTSSDPDNQIIEWFWNFGDGSSSKEEDPHHTYIKAGSYSISLTVKDELDYLDSYVHEIQVGDNTKKETQPEENANNFASSKLLLLIGIGIIFGGGSLVTLVLYKKKKQNEQIVKKIRINKKPKFFTLAEKESKTKNPKLSVFIILGLVGILAVVFGFFREKKFDSINGNFTSPPPNDSTNGDSTLENKSMKVSEIDGMTLLYVQSGEFLMGSPEGVGELNEQPQHIVNLNSFWIDQTEVTNLMYKICVDEGLCIEPSEGYYYSNAAYNNSPVTSINWDQAKTYCEWANRYLPTEAQWEKAARGTIGQTYPWGEETPTSNFANFGHKGAGDDKDIVGALSDSLSFPNGRSPYGVYNMAGNAAEWVSDWYGDYQDVSQNDPSGPETGEYRVVRGGSTINNENYIRSAFRNKAKPTTQNSTIGFRCAMPAE